MSNIYNIRQVDLDKCLQLAKENKNLIIDRDFEQLYNRIQLSDRVCFTLFLLNCGINPLEYMQEVPDCFAFNDYYNLIDLTQLILPECITTVGVEAFRLADLGGQLFANCNRVHSILSSAFQSCEFSTDKIILPDSIQAIGSCAFKNVSSTTGELHIYLPDIDKYYVSDDAFIQSIPDSSDIVTIHCYKTLYNMFINCPVFSKTRYELIV